MNNTRPWEILEIVKMMVISMIGVKQTIQPEYLGTQKTTYDTYHSLGRAVLYSVSITGVSYCEYVRCLL